MTNKTAISSWATSRLMGLAALLALLAAWITPASAAVDEPYKRAGDFAVYLGVVPAEIVRGHPTAHAEREMHGGAPKGRHDLHLVVAIFDAASGTRIGDAKVEATVSGIGHVGITNVSLEPMVIAETTTYGGYVNLSGNDRYTIKLDIRRPHGSPPASVEFTYGH